jgi:hypothetical protein
MPKGEKENYEERKGKARILKHISKTYLILGLKIWSSDTYRKVLCNVGK